MTTPERVDVGASEWRRVQPLWSYLRECVQIGPLGPNALTFAQQGGKVSLTPVEAEVMADAAMEWLDAHPPVAALEVLRAAYTELEAARLETMDQRDEARRKLAAVEALADGWDRSTHVYTSAKYGRELRAALDTP